jgi:hypothetical protein
MPTFPIQKPSKIYPNWDFWFETKPSGNPGLEPNAMTNDCFEMFLENCF